jgi:hypothetical protein
MLCLQHSRRDEDPFVQALRRAVEDAPSLTALLLATWQAARVLVIHLIEAVLAEGAHQPTVRHMRSRHPAGGALGCDFGRAAASAHQRCTPIPGLCLRSLCAIGHSSAVAGLGRRHGQPTRGGVLGASRWPSGMVHLPADLDTAVRADVPPPENTR